MLNEFFANKVNLCLSHNDTEFELFISNKRLPTVLVEVEFTLQNKSHLNDSVLSADNIDTLMGLKPGFMDLLGVTSRSDIRAYADTEFAVSRSAKILNEIVFIYIDDVNVNVVYASCISCLTRAKDCIESYSDSIYVNDPANDYKFVQGNFVDFSKFIHYHPRKDDMKCLRDTFQLLVVHLNLQGLNAMEYSYTSKCYCNKCERKCRSFLDSILSEMKDIYVTNLSLKAKTFHYIYNSDSFTTYDLNIIKSNCTVIDKSSTLGNVSFVDLELSTKRNMFQCSDLDVDTATIKKWLSIRRGDTPYLELSLIQDKTQVIYEVDLNKDPTSMFNEIKSKFKRNNWNLIRSGYGPFTSEIQFEGKSISETAGNKKMADKLVCNTFLRYLVETGLAQQVRL